jgi:hypothetical protein
MLKVRYLKIQNHTIDLLLYNFSYFRNYDCDLTKTLKSKLVIVSMVSNYKAFSEIEIFHDSISKLEDLQDVLDCRKKQWLNYKGQTKELNI